MRTVPRFNAREVLQFAVSIERNGERFYRKAADTVENPKVRDLFQFLAREEVGHERGFARLAAKLGDLMSSEDYSEEYVAYLTAYVENVAFSQKETEEALSAATDEATALRFAMQREQESILFYTELKSLVPEDERSSIDAVIDEERDHYRKLATLLGDLRDAS